MTVSLGYNLYTIRLSTDHQHQCLAPLQLICTPSGIPARSFIYRQDGGLPSQLNDEWLDMLIMHGEAFDFDTIDDDPRVTEFMAALFNILLIKLGKGLKLTDEMICEYADLYITSSLTSRYIKTRY